MLPKSHDSAQGILLRGRKRPWLAVLLSVAYPGLGHFYLEEDGLGAYLFFFVYLGFIPSITVFLLEFATVWAITPWLLFVWGAILVLAAADAYRLALRYNRYHGPGPGPAKRVDFVDSANAPVTRTSLRLR